MSNPLVTVIIPTYNRAHLLTHSVNSVLEQVLQDFELLIVDDGSVDETAQVVAAIPDARIKYIHQANQGICAAMNAGLSRARGQYIARLDSDDLWRPDMLKDLTHVLESNPGYGLAYAKAMTIDASGTPLGEVRGLPLWYPDDTFASMLYGDVTCNTCIVARRACFDRAGFFDPSFKVHEDWDLWLRVARIFPFYFLDKELACFRYHSQNITGPKSGEYTGNIDERVKVLEKAYAEGDLTPRAMDIRPLAFANAYIWMGADWWERRQYKRALKRFWKAWQARRYSVVAFFEISWGVTARLFLWKAAWGQKMILSIRKFKNRKVR